MTHPQTGLSRGKALSFAILVTAIQLLFYGCIDFFWSLGARDWMPGIEVAPLFVFPIFGPIAAIEMAAKTLGTQPPYARVMKTSVMMAILSVLMVVVADVFEEVNAPLVLVLGPYIFATLAVVLSAVSESEDAIPASRAK